MCIYVRIILCDLFHFMLWQDELADSHYVSRILEETRKFWNKMKDLREKSVKMTHDGGHCVCMFGVGNEMIFACLLCVYISPHTHAGLPMFFSIHKKNQEGLDELVM